MTALSRPVKFVIVGVWNTLFGYGTYAVLVFAFGRLAVTDSVRADLALTVAWPVNVFVAFLGYKYLVFGGGPEVVREFAKFSTVYVATFVFNLIALPLLVSYTPLGKYLAQALVVVACAAASYAFHSLFSFRQRGALPE